MIVCYLLVRVTEYSFGDKIGARWTKKHNRRTGLSLVSLPFFSCPS